MGKGSERSSERVRGTGQGRRGYRLLQTVSRSVHPVSPHLERTSASSLHVARAHSVPLVLAGAARSSGGSTLSTRSTVSSSGRCRLLSVTGRVRVFKSRRRDRGRSTVSFGVKTKGSPSSCTQAILLSSDRLVMVPWQQLSPSPLMLTCAPS